MPLPRVRRSILGAGTVVLCAAALLAFAAVDPSLLGDAWAQTENTEAVTPSQTPPPVPGLIYPEETAGSTALIEPALVPATPVVPEGAESAGNSGLVDSGAGMTTNLGGSDVAVASEGGSYEVDGPKRKANRIPKPTPKP